MFSAALHLGVRYIMSSRESSRGGWGPRLQVTCTSKQGTPISGARSMTTDRASRYVWKPDVAQQFDRLTPQHVDAHAVCCQRCREAERAQRVAADRSHRLVGMLSVPDTLYAVMCACSCVAGWQSVHSRLQQRRRCHGRHVTPPHRPARWLTA